MSGMLGMNKVILALLPSDVRDKMGVTYGHVPSNDLLDVKIAKSLVLGPFEHFQGFLWPTVGQVNTNFEGF